MRAEIQREMLDLYNTPLVSFTMNIAGPLKNSSVISRAFDLGIELIKKELVGYPLLEFRERRGSCGNAGFFSVDADACELKSRLVNIEDTHSLGRLFDMDVIDRSGAHLCRESERGCMVCGAPGRACAAGRLHPVEVIVAKTDEILTNYFTRVDAKRISAIATDSILAEVYTYPKPGLVDPKSRGSHPDMTVSDFERSAEAIGPYLEKFILSGAENKNAPADTVLPQLRKIGLEAERAMYDATNGKNTHKGIIFSFGIILGAIGMLMVADGSLPSVEAILEKAKIISQPHLSGELAMADGKTAGERAYLEYGARGIRGEAMDGFPAIKEISLPQYEKALESGKNKNDAGVITLLHLIANLYDTCLYKRGGNDGVTYAQSYAGSVIEKNEFKLEELVRMDSDFTKRNLSPGGCADLLALTYFLAELQKKR